MPNWWWLRWLKSIEWENFPFFHFYLSKQNTSAASSCLPGAKLINRLHCTGNCSVQSTRIIMLGTCKKKDKDKLVEILYNLQTDTHTGKNQSTTTFIVFCYRVGKGTRVWMCRSWKNATCVFFLFLCCTELCCVSKQIRVEIQRKRKTFLFLFSQVLVEGKLTRVAFFETECRKLLL